MVVGSVLVTGYVHLTYASIRKLDMLGHTSVWSHSYIQHFY